MTTIPVNKHSLGLIIENGRFQPVQNLSNADIEMLRVIEEMALRIVQHPYSEQTTAHKILCESLGNVAFLLTRGLFNNPTLNRRERTKIHVIYERIRNAIYPIDTLIPDEVVQQILFYLDYETLLRASCINRRWNRVGEEAQVKLSVKWGYSGENCGEAKALFRNLSAGMHALLQRKNTPHGFVVHQGKYPGFRYIHTEATLIKFKQAFPSYKQAFMTHYKACCCYGRYEEVQVLLYAGADPNLLINGLLPLQIAATTGHRQIMQLLIKHGADINQICNDGHSLMFYIISNHPGPEDSILEIVQLLLDHQVQIDETDDDNSSLRLAVSKGYLSIFGLLLGQVKMQSQTWDLMCFFIHNPIYQINEDFLIEILEVMIAKGFDLNLNVGYMSAFGPALVHAVHCGLSKVVALLIKHETKIENCYFEFALLHAEKNQPREIFLEIFTLLMKAGYNPQNSFLDYCKLPRRV